MSHKHRVLMLGGRRAGKSSLLASILYNLKYNSQSLCSCEDKTLYKSGVKDLEEKRKELERYIHRFNVIGGQSLFLVDANPSIEKGVYTIRTNIGSAFLDLEFVDVPGEWMSATSSGYAELLDEVQHSDIFVIAIDTPMLMEAPTHLARKYNRIPSIQSLMDNILVEQGEKKQILFCPIKCERWAQDGQLKAVIDKVCASYADLINSWVNQPGIEILVLPVLTAGGIEFAKQLPGMMIRRNPSMIREELCSFDVEKQRYLMPEGFFLNSNQNITVREDTVLNEFPLSWYKVNSNGYKPKNGENVTFLIIKFLVEKEMEYSKAQLERRRWWQFWKPPFGSYLNSFAAFVKQLSFDASEVKFINEYV